MEHFSCGVQARNLTIPLYKDFFYPGGLIWELAIIDKKLAMDSRDIARLTKKRHDHVIRDIRKMYEKLGIPKTGFTYKDSQNKDRPYYLLDYSDTITLLTGYSVELRKAVVDRWIFLEKHYRIERQKSIETRNTFTETLSEHGYTKQHEYIQTTNQMKKSLDIKHKKKEMTTRELDEVAATSNNGKNESIKLPDSFRLSDKFKVLYRYFKMPKAYKDAALSSINSLYKTSLKTTQKI